MTNTLYQWKDPISGLVAYGHQLATDSNGKAVMEIRGGGVVAVDKQLLEEVLPPTVGVQFLNSAEKTYHYFHDGRGLEVGDLLLVESLGQISQVVVKEVGSKSKSATKELKVLGKITLDKSFKNH